MGNTYTRQSSFTDGDVITADLFNNEYDQLLAAFAASTGHTHDGTAAEGGPITKLLGTSITIGDATAGSDITVTFDGETNDGELKWMEDEDYFEFSDDILIASDEKIQFRDTAIFINSSADGQLDLVADTEIQIAATTVDINGNVDVSGTLTVAGAVDFGDAALSNVGAVQLDSISGDADSNTSIAFSGSDVITVTAGGETQVTFNNGSILPTTDDDVDLGSSSFEFKDGFFDGTLHADAINFNGTAISATAAELNIMDGVTATTAEINTLDGITAVVGELNALDLGSTGTGTAINSKAVILDANKDYTGIRNLTLAGDLTISGDDLTMGTNTSGHLLIADGTNFNPTAVGDLSEISTVANDDVFLAVDTSGGGLKKITRSTIVSGLAVGGVAISNVVEDSTPQLGGDLDVNGNGIVSASNGNIAITPNGSGVVRIDGSNGIDMQSGAISIKNSGAQSYVRFYCEASNAHYAQLQAPAHSAFSGNITLTLPATTDTLVGKTTTDTLTNKTLTDPVITNITGSTITLDSAGDITLDADGADVLLKDGGTTYGGLTNSSGELVIKSGTTSAMTFSGANVTIEGNLTVSGTTTTVNSTTVTLNDHNIVLDSNNSTSAVVNGAGITIEGGSGDDATFTYNTTGPKFELKLGSNHEDLQVDQLIAASLDISGDIDVDGTANLDVVDIDGAVDMASTLAVGGVVTANAGVVVDNITIDGTEIDLSSGDLTVDVAGDIILDADGGDFKFQDGGTEVLRITNSSSDVIIRPVVDAKDLIFQQRDGTEVARIEDNGTFNVVTDKLAINGTAVTSTAAELNILDGATATASELNLLDGDTSVGSSITLADADGFIVNDNGTMKTIPASDVKTYAAGSAATKGFAIAMAIVFG